MVFGVKIIQPITPEIKVSKNVNFFIKNFTKLDTFYKITNNYYLLSLVGLFLFNDLDFLRFSFCIRTQSTYNAIHNQSQAILHMILQL